MMSRKEYMDWQNRQDRVSEYICVPASGAIFGVFNSFTVKKVNFFTINVKFKVILSSKSGGGGIFVQAIPPPKKVGGGGGCIPPSPRDLRQWTEVKLNLTFRNRIWFKPHLDRSYGLSQV